MTQPKPMLPFSEQLSAESAKLRAYARALSGDRTLADDLVQETLLKAWANQTSYDSAQPLRNWLFTIMRNTFFSDHKKRRQESEVLAHYCPEDDSVDGNQTANIELSELQHALNELPAEFRDALVLVSVEGLTCADAAKICGCPAGTIKSRVSRARLELKRIMSKSSQRTRSA